MSDLENRRGEELKVSEEFQRCLRKNRLTADQIFSIENALHERDLKNLMV